MNIALDYGHCLYGPDKGYRGNGYKEEVCTREIGILLKKKLEEVGHNVIEVAPELSKSEFESINIRVLRINSYEVDLSISLHLNIGIGNGVEIYTKDGSEYEVAINILYNFETMGYNNRGIKNGSDIAVVGGVRGQAMLIQCGFIDSIKDMRRYDPDKIATAISNGIIEMEINNSANRPAERYLNLDPSVVSWKVYSLQKELNLNEEVGCISPYQVEGMSFKILNSPKTDIYTIATIEFGVVNIIAVEDNDCSITYQPLY